MRIVNFDKNGTPTLAVRVGRKLVDLSVAAPELPRELKGLVAGGRRALDNAAAAAKAAGKEATVDEKKIKYLPPVHNPSKVICLGLNYRDHAIETGNKIPPYPVVFTRENTTLVGHGQPMVRPKASKDFDYEAELAVVIGTGGRHISKARALDHVAGYSCFNDGSIRDYQRKSSQFIMGKNFDATGGFGPELVTADELPKGGNGLPISCKLNGKTVQSSNTNQHIFDVPTTIHLLSVAMTLEPGDVLVMGTPSGVGMARKPQLWMKQGDKCEVIIKGIGTLLNPIVNEK